MARIVRRFEGPTVADVEGTVRQEIRGLAEAGKLRVKPRARIAVAVGSRGVADIQLITKTTVAVLRELGADPFIVPAMEATGRHRTGASRCVSWIRYHLGDGQGAGSGYDGSSATWHDVYGRAGV